jgi:hypothetical protein
MVVCPGSTKILSSKRSLPVWITKRRWEDRLSLFFLGRPLLVTFDYTCKMSRSQSQLAETLNRLDRGRGDAIDLLYCIIVPNSKP